MKKLILLSAIVIFYNTSFGQTIQNVDVLPISPTTSDTVFISVDYMFTSGPCDLVHQNFTKSGNNISTLHFHCPGMLTVICPGTDVIEIGQLAAGSYSLTVNLFEGTYDSLGNCSQFTQTDLKTSTFNVALGTGVNQLNKPKPIVYLNKENVTISNLNTEYQFMLFDVAGKEIISRKVSSTNNNFYVSVENGVYFYSLRANGAQEFTGKLIVGN